MQIEYFAQKAFWSRGTPASVPEGWVCWSDGSLVGNHFVSSEHRVRAKTVHATPRDVIGESHFERCILASILCEVPSKTLVFMELGAGWGGQSLSVTQMVRNGLAPQVKDVWCFAVEPEPGHHTFICETFRVNSVLGVVVFGAVSDKLGWVNFYATESPASHYGQSVRSDGNLQVPCYTVDYLADMFQLSHIDIVHVDVQREELQVLVGAERTMAAGIIDYMLVCPHYGIDVADVIGLLEPYFDVIISVPARSGYLMVPNFPKEIHHPQDGIIVCKRKGLVAT